LHWAASRSNDPGVINALLKAGADIHAQDTMEYTPLHIAAIGNADPAVIAELITSGAETYLKDDSGKTPYDYAKKNKLLKETDGDGYRMLELSE